MIRSMGKDCVYAPVLLNVRARILNLKDYFKIYQALIVKVSEDWNIIPVNPGIMKRVGRVAGSG